MCIRDRTDAWLETVSIEKTEIVSEDGLTLRALQYTADPSAHRYALVIHGYTSNKEAMQTEARHFSDVYKRQKIGCRYIGFFGYIQRL